MTGRMLSMIGKMLYVDGKEEPLCAKVSTTKNEVQRENEFKPKDGGSQ
jgi:hypothetical protein